MLSLFFVLSPRGDTIISKDYRGDSPQGAQEALFRKVKAGMPPVLLIDAVTYLWVKKNGLIFACNTRFNASASLCIELLNRVIKVVRDYCGVLSEEAIRKNFILIYELLDEVLDFGYPQGTSTESLKSFVYNEAVWQKTRMSVNAKTTPSSAVQKPISGVTSLQPTGKNEIFVDILERLTIVFSASGTVVNSTIDGSIQMKSYLSGNPELRLALNEDLVVGKGGAYGSVILDDCNFHECVRLDDFETARLLSFYPPDGEFVVLNYRCTGEFRAPFRVLPSIEELAPFQLEVLVIIRADVPETNYGANVVITIPVPKSTASVTLGSNAMGHTSDYNAADKKITYTVKKFQGGTEHAFKAKLSLSSVCTQQTRKEIGPVSLQFEIPMYNVSNLQVKYLRIAEQNKGYNPYRWVRYVTRSSSYVCRV